jgi:hypothetical protein
MSKPLDDMLERVKSWPKHRQEDAAEVLEAMEHSGIGVQRLTGEERKAVEVGLAQATLGHFVSNADLEAFWNRNRK